MKAQKLMKYKTRTREEPVYYFRRVYFFALITMRGIGRQTEIGR